MIVDRHTLGMTLSQCEGICDGSTSARLVCVHVLVSDCLLRCDGSARIVRMLPDVK